MPHRPALPRHGSTTLQPTDLAFHGLDLAAIHPDRGAKYSPNLFAWLTAVRAGRLTPRARLSGIYIDSSGAQWIGYTRDQAGFVGQRVSSVLAEGHGAGIGAWLHLGPMRPLLGFWAKYIQVGRCALDEGHGSRLVYSEHRWARDGGTRHCRWCGLGTQVLTRWTEAQECQAWVASADDPAPLGGQATSHE